MGQKVHPVGIRLGIVKEHNSLWYAGPKSYSDCLVTDLQVREFLFKRLKNASVSRIKIERPSENVRITIATARPGIVIGKKGEDVERLRRDVAAQMGVPVHINIEEVRKPDLDARLFLLNLLPATKHFATEDPHLDTDGAVSGFSTYACVIDVGTQSMQRHSALAVPFGTRNFCTTQTTGQLNLDTFSTGLHGVLNRTLHVSRCGSSVAKCLVAWSRFSRKSSRSSPRARRSAAAVKG